MCSTSDQRLLQPIAVKESREFSQVLASKWTHLFLSSKWLLRSWSKSSLVICLVYLSSETYGDGKRQNNLCMPWFSLLWPVPSLYLFQLMEAKEKANQVQKPYKKMETSSYTDLQQELNVLLSKSLEVWPWMLPLAVELIQVDWLHVAESGQVQTAVHWWRYLNSRTKHLY